MDKPPQCVILYTYKKERSVGAMARGCKAGNKYFWLAVGIVVLLLAALLLCALYKLWSRPRCPHCGKHALPGGEYCPYCGKKLGD